MGGSDQAKSNSSHPSGADVRRSEGSDARSIIKAAFLRLYEESSSIKDIPAERLAREAGYSRAAFYRYYHSVDEVLSELEDEALPTAESTFIVEHVDVISSDLFIQLYLEYFSRKEDELRILLSHDAKGRFYRKLSETILPAFKALSTLTLADEVSSREADRLAEYLVDTKLNQMRAWAADPSEPLAEYMRLPLETVERSFWKKKD